LLKQQARAAEASSKAGSKSQGAGSSVGIKSLAESKKAGSKTSKK
jgi:hypothetical protein